MPYIRLTPQIVVSDKELNFTFSRSSGPGGQNVNKVNTRTTLCWNLEANSSIPLALKDYLVIQLGNSITATGDVKISSDRFRSQDRNREDCLDNLKKLLKKASHKPKRRKKTKPTRASKEKRIRQKKERSEVKRMRKKVL